MMGAIKELSETTDDVVGKEFWFEYHCFESPKSCDAELWYRTHNKVLVLSIVELGCGDTKLERLLEGCPRVYRVVFEDGFEYDVFEDELMESKEEFERPDAPKRNLQEQISKIKSMMGIKPKKHSFDYHEHLVELFLGEQKELDEDNYDFEIDDIKEEVISKIKNNEFSDDPQEFYNAINRSKKHKEMLSEYSVDDFAEMKLFKLDGYDIGYALKKSQDNGYNEIVSVFNNSDVKGIGNELMKSAINNGGCYLDHYDGFLSDFYSSLGFEEYDRYEFDPQYDPDGEFEKKYGRQDIIFRKHKNC